MFVLWRLLKTDGNGEFDNDQTTLIMVWRKEGKVSYYRYLNGKGYTMTAATMSWAIFLCFLLRESFLYEVHFSVNLQPSPSFPLSLQPEQVSPYQCK